MSTAEERRVQLKKSIPSSMLFSMRILGMRPMRWAADRVSLLVNIQGRLPRSLDRRRSTVEVAVVVVQIDLPFQDARRSFFFFFFFLLGFFFG